MTFERQAVVEVTENTRKGKVLGFTSGVFDILHPGHVDYLTKARAQSDLLVVGVNSDKSVKGNKGPLRPICSEHDRAAVLLGLSAVDYVFIFDEPNNNQNITLLKPEIYFKAGDYSKEQLSSAPIVEGYGGRVEIIPFLSGYSSSEIIEQIEQQAVRQLCSHLEQPTKEKRPAAFIDRDGTICKHVEYLHEPEKFELLPGVIEGLKKLQAAGYRLVVVTNQPGVGIGYFSKEDFYRVTKEMFRQLSAGGIIIDKVYFSPYSKADYSPCRKPGTALVERAVEELNLDLGGSVVIGDTTSDIQLAKNLGIKSVLVKTGESGQDGLYNVESDFKAASLHEAADWIVHLKE